MILIEGYHISQVIPMKSFLFIGSISRPTFEDKIHQHFIDTPNIILSSKDQNRNKRIHL